MKLFSQIPIGFPFHYGDKPERILVKAKHNRAVSAGGIKITHPHVLVFEETSRRSERPKWESPQNKKS